jgi:1,4-dihydroxy-2-naphthoate octaprenyltransferase
MNLKRIMKMKSVIRPDLLFVLINAVILGTAMALGDGISRWTSALVCLWFAVTLHLGFHLLHCAFGQTAPPQEITGQKILWAESEPEIKPKNFSGIGTVFFLLALPASLLLIISCGKSFAYVIVGIYAVLVATMLLTHKIHNRATSNFLTGMFYGLVPVTMTYYAQSWEMNYAVVWAGTAPGLFAVAFQQIFQRQEILKHVDESNSLDLLFGKTIVTDYMLSLLMASIVPVIIYFQTADHVITLAATFISVLAAPGIKLFFQNKDEKSQNHLRRWTLQLLLVYVVLFSIGWML